MAKGTLDDILEGAKILARSEEISKKNQEHGEISTIYEALKFIEDPAYMENPEMYEVIRTDSVQRGVVAEEVLPKVQKKLEEYVSENRNEIIENLNKDSLVSLAISQSDEGKHLRAFYHALEKKDIETLKDVLASKVKNSVYNSVLLWATPDQILQAGEITYKRLERDFMNTHLSSKEVKNNQPTGNFVYDSAKAKSYVRKMLTNEKILKNATFQLVNSYAASRQRQE